MSKLQQIITAYQQSIYAVWNIADKAAGAVISNGGLTYSNPNGAGGLAGARATVGVSSGKWYWEVTFDTGASIVIGVGNISAALIGDIPDSNMWAWGNYRYGWGYYANSTVTAGPTLVNGDILGFALDMDAGTIQLYLNGSIVGSPKTGLSGTLYPYVNGNWEAGNHQGTANFGPNNFAYSVPGSFNAGIFVRI